MTQLFRIIASLLFLFAGTVASLAQERIALIVGNGSYSSVTQLDNTVPDAELMAQVLRDKGFKVTLLTNTDQHTLNIGISQFGRDLRGAGKDATGLFYYAGHAVQSFGENYLLPTDAALRDAADLSLVAVDAQAVLRQMRSARNKTNIVILDACRNNPFEEIPELNDNGLAEMKAPTGTFLSYSTAPGAVALDGLDGNSPFTKALAREIPIAGVPIEQTFKKVRVQVIEATSGRQTPWDTSSLTGDFFFEATKRLTALELQEKQLWDSVSESDDPVQVMLFLRSYPKGLFQEDARTLLTNLMAQELGSTNIAEAKNPTEEIAVAPVQVPAPTAPAAAAARVASEAELIGIAQASGDAADYQAYLDAYPRGTYAELADFEIKIIAQKAERAAAAAQAPQPAETPEPVETATAPAPADHSGLTFTMPFRTGGAPIEGKSISQIVELSPSFPPIEGLPEELWKEQTCSNCHSWTKDALCTQGT
ncbi:MAG: caspase family protein, partial [Sulfitobacter sp.]